MRLYLPARHRGSPYTPPPVVPGSLTLDPRGRPEIRCFDLPRHMHTGSLMVCAVGYFPSDAAKRGCTLPFACVGLPVSASSLPRIDPRLTSLFLLL